MLKPRNENPEGMGRTVEASGMKSKDKPSGDDFALRLQSMTDEEVSKGFQWFCQERESIRLKKEEGKERPWTEDEIMDKTKFTNIFRQHDKVSMFIFSKCGELSGPTLVYNLLMSRLLNRVDVLNKFLPCSHQDDLSFLLDGEAILMNAGAYQISPQMIRLGKFKTNRETIVYHPVKVYEGVYEAITSTTDIEEAVQLGNKAFGGHIPFTMLQVVLDYQYLTRHYDDNSNVPVGQGAKAIVDKLGGLEVASKKFGMKKYDVEHAACEYRKYLHRQGKTLSRYSYKENSMGI